MAKSTNFSCNQLGQFVYHNFCQFQLNILPELGTVHPKLVLAFYLNNFPCNYLFAILARLNIPSDPVVNFFDPVITCSFCNGKGHSKLSCHYAKAKTPSDISYDDMVFWSYVHPEDRPQCLKDFDYENWDFISESDTVGESDTESESDTEGESDIDDESDTEVDSDTDSDFE